MNPFKAASRRHTSGSHTATALQYAFLAILILVGKPAVAQDVISEALVSFTAVPEYSPATPTPTHTPSPLPTLTPTPTPTTVIPGGSGSVCGNGSTEGNEQCDDANAVFGDGCTPGCRSEFCGDGILHPALGEICDDGNFRSNDGCSSTCQPESCGDGIIQHEGARIEQCDDGNRAAGDGCSPNCVVERCGNGIIEAGEQCDDHNRTNDDGCSNTCKLPVCGDGIRAGAEQCDDGNRKMKDGCNNQCRLTFCGDGIIQRPRGEECDLKPQNLKKCSATCQIVNRKPGPKPPPAFVNPGAAAGGLQQAPGVVIGGGGNAGGGLIQIDLGGNNGSISEEITTNVIPSPSELANLTLSCGTSSNSATLGRGAQRAKKDAKVSIGMVTRPNGKVIIAGEIKTAGGKIFNVVSNPKKGGFFVQRTRPDKVKDDPKLRSKRQKQKHLAVGRESERSRRIARSPFRRRIAPASLLSHPELSAAYAASQQCDSSINVLFAYSKLDMSSMNQDQILAGAVYSLCAANEALGNSNVPFGVSLAGLVALDGPLTGGNDIMQSIAQGSGSFAKVKEERLAKRADVVTFVLSSFPGSSSCGFANLMRSPSLDFAPHAINVVYSGCLSSGLTWAHEFGHNAGLDHDAANSAGGTFRPDSHGWKIGPYRSIMAYPPGERIKMFSDPFLAHNDFIMGQAGIANNADVLRETLPVVSCFSDMP